MRREGRLLLIEAERSKKGTRRNGDQRSSSIYVEWRDEAYSDHGTAQNTKEINVSESIRASKIGRTRRDDSRKEQRADQRFQASLSVSFPPVSSLQTLDLFRKLHPPA